MIDTKCHHLLARFLAPGGHASETPGTVDAAENGKPHNITLLNDNAAGGTLPEDLASSSGWVLLPVV
jgi:hypothetical protein